MRELDVNPFFFKGGSIGCLLIHGFSGSPPEMRPMGECLARKGLTVLGVRLAGHGTTPEDMARTGWRDWVASAEEGLQELGGQCRQVFVAGLSMGGLITLHLAANHRPDGYRRLAGYRRMAGIRRLAGIVVMSTPAYIADWRFPFVPLIWPFIPWVTPPIESDLTDPQAETRFSAYNRLPTRCIASLGQLMRLVRRELPQVQVPALIMQGAHDHHIPPDSARIIFDRLGGTDKKIGWWSNSGHAITIDSEREAVWAQAYAFIAAHSEKEK